MRERDITNESTKFLRLVPAALVAALACQGCGDVDGNTTETVQGELKAFGSWTSMGNFALRDSPALAKTAGTTLTAFGWGTDRQIWTTAQNANGQWTGVWTALPGGTFDSRPAVASLNVASGPLVNHFAIVAMRNRVYYVRIQDQSGTHVVQDWMPTALGPGIWASAPSLVFTPADGGALVLAGTASIVGLGSRVLGFRESLNNMSLGFLKQFSFTDEFAADTAPALAYVPPVLVATRDVIIAAGVNGLQGVTYKSAWCNTFSNLGPRCEAWQTAPNGTFMSDPALAVGISRGLFPPVTQQTELTLYGLGLGTSGIWVTNQVPNGSFSPIGTTAVSGNPSAFGYGNRVTIAALFGGLPVTATALSPL